MKLSRSILYLQVFVILLHFSSNGQNAGQLHNLIIGKKYQELIAALDNGADPVSLVFEGGGIHLGKRVAASGEDLMSRLLQMPVSAERNAAIKKLIEKKVILSSAPLHKYSIEYCQDPENKTNTQLAEFLAQNDPEADRAMPFALKNRFDYFLKLLEKKYTFSNYKDALATAAYESDSTEFLKELIKKFGVYPKQKNGLMPARITQTTRMKKSSTESADSTIILFVNAGATFEETINFKEKYIHWLARCPDSMLLKAICNHASFVFKQRDENGQSLIHLMVIQKNTKFLPLITTHFKELNIQDKFKKTALDYADKNDLKTRRLLNDQFSDEETVCISFLDLCEKSALNSSEISLLNNLVATHNKALWFNTFDKNRKMDAHSFFLLAGEHNNAEAMAVLAKNEKVQEKMADRFEKWLKEDKHSLAMRSMLHNTQLLKKITWLIDNDISRDFSSTEKRAYTSAIVSNKNTGEMQSFLKEQFKEYKNVKAIDSGYVFIMEKDGKKGMMTLGGKTLAPAVYDDLDQINNVYSFKAKTASDYNYLILDHNCQKIATISSSENMRAPEIVVWQKNQFLIFESEKGKQIYDNTYGEYVKVRIEDVQEFKRLNNTYIAIRKNDKWGLWYYMNSINDVRFKFDDLKAAEENPNEEIEYQIEKKRKRAMMNDLFDLFIK